MENMEFVCTQCSEPFDTIDLLLEHVKVHSKEKPLVCPFCDTTFTFLSNLKRHIKTHATENTYVNCDNCGKYFKDENYLETRHKLKCKGKSHKCDQCDQVFALRAALRSHKKMHHPFKSPMSDSSNKKLYKCKYCASISQTKTEHKIHKTNCEGKDMVHQCSYCQKVFRHKVRLTAHLMTHTGEKPYQCSYCDSSFQRKCDLNNHIRRHTGEKPYKCSFCDWSFISKKNLIVHTRLHTGEKPFKCKYCEKSFSSRNGCNDHVRTHTGEKLQCKHCEKSFTHRGKLDKHMKTHRQKQIEGTSDNLGHTMKSRPVTSKNHPNSCNYQSNTFIGSPNSKNRIIFGMAYKAASMTERVKPDSFKLVYNQYLLANGIPVIEPLYSTKEQELAVLELKHTELG